MVVENSETYDRADCAVFRKTREGFGGLSNMASGYPLLVNGITIRSSEALYQACRFPHLPEVQKRIIEEKSPMLAKRKGMPHRDQSRSDWDRVRIRIMRWCLRIKLAQNYLSFRELLLSTEDRPIVEESYKDDFWGAKPQSNGTLIGNNVLGRLLVELREDSQKPTAEALKRVEPVPIPDFLLYSEAIQPMEPWEMADAALIDPDLNPARTAIWQLEDSKTTESKETGQRYPKRLIEVDLPIARISAHARREKSIRHGHISTLHIWWARRPLAACRAVICASLWPDPADPLCPQAFREAAVVVLTAFAKRVFPKKITDEKKTLQKTASEESLGRWEMLADEKTRLDPTDESHLNILRFALLDFIADFANWDNSTVPAYLETSRALTQAAHEALGGQPGTRPLVVDPFAGGGSIPLEALRVGADAFASDLNPVAVLLNKVVLEYIPKYGKRLAEEVRKWGKWVKEQAEKELAEFYPQDPDGVRPVAYLWARTVASEAPGHSATPVEVPLIRSLWLCKKRSRRFALRWSRNSDGDVLTEPIEIDYADGLKRKVLILQRRICCPFTQ